MSTAPSSSSPTAPPSHGAVLARAVAERWAEAVKAQSIYPAGHARVMTALDGLEQALTQARNASADKSAVEVVFADGGVLAQGTRFDVPADGSLAWLRERLDHVALAGVQFLPGATREAVTALGLRLLEASATKARRLDPGTEFADVGAGLRLLDRRFEGVFSGGDATTPTPQRTWGGLGPPLDARGRTRLAESLRADPTIRRRLVAIRKHLGDRAEAGEDGGWELLHRLTGVLPASAAGDMTRVRILAGGLLDALESRIQASDPSEGLAAFFEDPALARRVAFLSTSLVRGEEWKQGEAEQENVRRARGHEQDDRITDDLAAFCFELLRLPKWAESPESTDPLESRAETLGVLLHLLLRQEGEGPFAGFDGALRSALTHPGPAEARVLRRVLDATAHRADDVDAAVGTDLTLAALRRVGHLALARRCGFLSVERVAAVFPRDFTTWFDALDLASAGDRAELAQVLAQLGPERIEAAAPEILHADTLLEPARLERLLAVPDAVLAPLVDLLHRHGGPAHRPWVIAWLRGLPADGPETAPLHLVDEPAELPADYVSLLLARLLGRAPATPPDDLVVSLLARFVRATSGRADRRARRIQALRHMAGYDRPEAAAVLRSLAYGRRWLVLPIEEKPVRMAAREALARRGAA